MSGKIITRHVHPPIPADMGFDWCAFHDGDEEQGNYGWGCTEAEALADLARLDQERAEYEEDMLRDASNSSDLRYRMYRVNQEKEK